MIVLLVVLVPIIALSVWGITFDLKRRRRHEPLTSQDIRLAIRLVRADADARGGGPRVSRSS